MEPKPGQLPRHPDPPRPGAPGATCSCVDWYAEGESRIIECGDVRVTIRFVGRKGRRGRIVIEAPAGASFSRA